MLTIGLEPGNPSTTEYSANPLNLPSPKYEFPESVVENTAVIVKPEDERFNSSVLTDGLDADALNSEHPVSVHPANVDLVVFKAAVPTMLPAIMATPVRLSAVFGLALMNVAEFTA